VQQEEEEEAPVHSLRTLDSLPEVSEEEENDSCPDDSKQKECAEEGMACVETLHSASSHHAMMLASTSSSSSGRRGHLARCAMASARSFVGSVARAVVHASDFASDDAVVVRSRSRTRASAQLNYGSLRNLMGRRPLIVPEMPSAGDELQEPSQQEDPFEPPSAALRSPTRREAWAD